jgi:hypothetical protein
MGSPPHASGVPLALTLCQNRAFPLPAAVPEFGKKPDHDGSPFD